MGADDDPLASAVRGRVRTDPAELERCRRDASHLAGDPTAVVAPRDTEDVAALVRWARRNRTPLVARGAGTSLDGESVPTEGGVIVDFSGWNSVLEIAPEELSAVVGPGVVNWSLQEALRPHGLFFPPNPGSWTTCTIGGNVGTNASGPRSFRYGPTRVWVRSVEVVLGTGVPVRWGARTAKRSTGPDLLQLVIGSEGTLGLVTEVTVRVAARPAERDGLIVPLPVGISLGSVASRLARLADSGLSAVEYLDRPSSSALRASGRADLPADEAFLLLEIEAATRGELAARRARVAAALEAVGVSAPPIVFDDADRLWMLRGESGVVLDERMGIRVREDVAVPLPRIDALVRRLEAIGRDAGAPLFLFGHLGEGSLHPNYVVEPGSPAAERIRAELLDAALALGGTVSSEHGIGHVKRPFLARELGPAAIALLRAVKRQCDPDGILNPGKLYPDARAARAPSRSPSAARDAAVRPR